MKKTKRTTITIDEDLHLFWKKNMSVPLSRFVKEKMIEASSSFAQKKEEKPKPAFKQQSVNWNNLKWMK